MHAYLVITLPSYLLQWLRIKRRQTNHSLGLHFLHGRSCQTKRGHLLRSTTYASEYHDFVALLARLFQCARVFFCFLLREACATETERPHRQTESLVTYGFLLRLYPYVTFGRAVTLIVTQSGVVVNVVSWFSTPCRRLDRGLFSPPHSESTMQTSDPSFPVTYAATSVDLSPTPTTLNVLCCYREMTYVL